MGTGTSAKLRSMWAIVWRIALFFLAFALLGALFIVPFDSTLSAWRETVPLRAQLYGDIAVAVAMLAATWIMTRFVDRRPFVTIGFAPGHALRDLALGLTLGTGWLALSVGGAWLAGCASPQSPEAFSSSLLLGTAVSFLFNVLTQQLLLCGYIFQTIRSRSRFVVALLISAALFSAYHAGAFGGEWLPALNVFAAGALFCLAFGITGNLWFPIATHFAWNFLLGPVLGLTISGSSRLGEGGAVFVVEGPALFTGGDFGLEGGLIVTVTTALCIAALLLVRRRQPREDRAAT